MLYTRVLLAHGYRGSEFCEFAYYFIVYIVFLTTTSLEEYCRGAVSNASKSKLGGYINKQSSIPRDIKHTTFSSFMAASSFTRP